MHEILFYLHEAISGYSYRVCDSSVLINTFLYFAVLICCMKNKQEEHTIETSLCRLILEQQMRIK